LATAVTAAVLAVLLLLSALLRRHNVRKGRH
jgi:hypothetical protein